VGIEELLQSKRQDILRLAEKHGAHNVRVFGSVLRGEAGPESDIDLLIDLEAGRSLLEHAALLLELEDLLGRKVDVVTERGLRPRVRERVLSEAQPL
jgi:predicted nucleotidyltransferase